MVQIWSYLFRRWSEKLKNYQNTLNRKHLIGFDWCKVWGSVKFVCMTVWLNRDNGIGCMQMSMSKHNLTNTKFFVNIVLFSWKNVRIFYEIIKGVHQNIFKGDLLKRILQADKMNNQIILATGGYDHTIKLWRAETKDCIKSMQHADSVKFPKHCFVRNNFLISIRFSQFSKWMPWKSHRINRW